MTEKENAVAVEGEGGGRDGEEEFDKNKRKRPDESTPKDHHQHKEEQTNDDRASSTSSPPPVIVAITISRPEEEFSSELPKPESGALQRSDSYHEVCRYYYFCLHVCDHICIGGYQSNSNLYSKLSMMVPTRL